MVAEHGAVEADGELVLKLRSAYLEHPEAS